MRPLAREIIRTSGAAMLACAALLLSACAPSAASRNDAPHAARPATRLEAIAARELRSRPRPTDAPIPPGLDASDIAPVAPTNAAALAPLDETILELAPDLPPAAVPALSPEPDALRRYIAGREALLQGQFELAEEELLAAAELDPDAAEPWRDLAEVRNASGDAPGAVAASLETLKRDPRSIDALANAGLHRLRRADLQEGARLLATALRLIDAREVESDAAMPYVLSRYLGVALDEMGRAASAETLLTRAASVPEPFPTLSRYASELASLTRSRPAVWMRVGDLRMSLDRPADALAAYDAALDAAPQQPPDLLSRRVYALMRTDRPHAAAAALLDALREQGTPDARLLALAGYLRETEPRAASRLAESVAQYESALAPETRAAAQGALLLLSASLAPPEEAIRTLRERLVASPGDPAAAGALVELLADGEQPDPQSLLGEVVRLVDATPYAFRVQMRALLDARFPPSELLPILESLPPELQSSLGGALVRTHLTFGQDPARAAQLAADAAQRFPGAPSIALQRVEILTTLARFEDARAFADAIDPDAGPDARLARASALAELGDSQEALRIAAPLADDPDAGVVTLSQAANLAMNAGDVLLAERWCLLLTERAPQREEGYVGLLNLYGADTALQDEDKASDTLRRLRANVPNSRMVRVLAARELAQRGNLDYAGQQLESVLDEQPADASAAALLIAIRIQEGRADEAVRAAEDLVRLSPENPNFAQMLAESLTRAERPQEAADLLRRRLASRPGEFDVSRTLESILRGPLASPAEADAVAMERLTRAPRTARTLLELAELHQRRRDLRRTAETLLELLSDSARVLAPDERSVAVSLGERLARLSLEEDPTLAPESAAVLQGLLDRGAVLSLPGHRWRLQTLAMTDAQTEQIARAARTAASQHPESGASAWEQAVDSLRAAERCADAVTLARLASEELRGYTSALSTLMIYCAIDASDVGAAIDAVRGAQRDGVAQELFRILFPGEQAVNSHAAEVAYALAIDFQSRGLEDEGDRLYRVALEFDPDHAMANNNLGYRLTEQGRDLEDAYRMLVRAHRARPDEASVIDSMGWVLYRLGVLEDRVGEDGAVEQEGAITLLRRAAERARDPNRPQENDVHIILDHLGDALYRAGRVDEAQDAWRTAAQSARAALRIAELREGRPIELQRSAMRADLSRIDAKLRALDTGAQPQTAEILGDGTLPDPPSRTEPGPKPEAPADADAAA